MINAKAINLRVRPLQSVDLSFPMDGIVGAQPDIHLLGKAVKAFDLSAFYALLGTALSPMVWIPPKMDPAHGTFTPGRYVPLPASDQPLGWGRLKYDSRAIWEEISASILFALRAEQIKAALDKAVGLRENVWVQKYEDAPYRATQKAFNRDDPNSKLNRLQNLVSISKQQHDRLQAEYADFNAAGAVVNKGVIKASVTNSFTNSAPLRTTPQGGGSIQDWDTTRTNVSTQTISSSTRGYEYRHPSLENDAQFERAQISLVDEQLAAIAAANYVSGSQLEHDANHAFNRPPSLTSRYFANDLQAIDLDIKRLQVAYIDTFLVSPIDGVVTGVFRNTGDFVRAAQPVVRVENDAEIYLVGILKYRGIIGIGQNISVSTKLFDMQDRSVSGVVAAVRGHDSEDELWDILIRCGNRDAAGLPLFPINYNFDFENTTVEVI